MNYTFQYMFAIIAISVGVGMTSDIGHGILTFGMLLLGLTLMSNITSGRL